MSKSQTPNVVVILNNIRSNENVGSIFRTCDAAGVRKIFLVGYTPAPLDRFGRINKALAKAALGAERFVEYEKVESLKEVIVKLRNYFSPLASARTTVSRKPRSEKDSGAFKIVAIEQDKQAIDYKKLNLLAPSVQRLALVFGNEVEGLSKEDLALCDMVAEIPMKGFMVRQAHHPHNTKVGKESLNVAVAVGVVLFSLPHP